MEVSKSSCHRRIVVSVGGGEVYETVPGGRKGSWETLWPKGIFHAKKGILRPKGDDHAQKGFFMPVSLMPIRADSCPNESFQYPPGDKKQIYAHTLLPE